MISGLRCSLLGLRTAITLNKEEKCLADVSKITYGSLYGGVSAGARGAVNVA
jgi:hypothetical protein